MARRPPPPVALPVPELSGRKVLIVDDDRSIVSKVRDGLTALGPGLELFEANDGTAALSVLRAQRPDLLITDVEMPGMSGMDLCRIVKANQSVSGFGFVPVILVTSRREGKIEGLELGADDYLVKPFSPRELVARVEAVLRRAGGGRAEGPLSFGGGKILIDRETRELTAAGKQIELTRSEFDLLHALASRPGRVYSRYELVSRVQGYDYEGYERTIDAHVKNLRRKLGDDPKNPRYVITVAGVGYKFGLRADA